MRTEVGAVTAGDAKGLVKGVERGEGRWDVLHLRARRGAVSVTASLAQTDDVPGA